MYFRKRVQRPNPQQSISLGRGKKQRTEKEHKSSYETVQRSNTDDFSPVPDSSVGLCGPDSA